jgi:hypothetical protein
VPRKSAAETLEDDTEGYLTKQVKALRGATRKFKDRRGDPDRLVILPGVPAFLVETKRPVGGRYQPLQKRRIEHFRKLGMHVYLCRTRADVDAVLLWERDCSRYLSDFPSPPCQKL